MALPACKCRKVIETLKRLGARHAAYMHDLAARGVPHEWTREDWLLHFREEEVLLFPLLIARGHGPLVRKLAGEHAFFRNELTQYGRIVSLDRMDKHAEIEDQAVLSLAAA